jgi:hypothetical protein
MRPAAERPSYCSPHRQAEPCALADRQQPGVTRILFALGTERDQDVRLTERALAS